MSELTAQVAAHKEEVVALEKSTLHAQSTVEHLQVGVLLEKALRVCIPCSRSVPSQRVLVLGWNLDSRIIFASTCKLLRIGNACVLDAAESCMSLCEGV